MPELPEVETTRRGLEPVLVGRTITSVRIRNPHLRWKIPADFARELSGRRIRAVARRAKYLLIDVGDATLLVHLGMSGNLRSVEASLAPLKHDHVDLVLDSGMAVRFNDPRRFGCLLLVHGDPASHPRLRHLGPEPLSDAFTPDHLYAASRARRIALKPFLMNAAVVVGVGNIYASEALFRARLDPRRAACRLTRPEAVRLVAAIRRVLAAAIRVGGTTLRDYVNADGLPGYFRQKLYVYERAGLPCRRCGTAIRQVTQAQRSTYWCPSCQRGTGRAPRAARAATRGSRRAAR